MSLKQPKNNCWAKGEDVVDHSDQMVQEMLLKLQDPQQSVKVRYV